MAAIWRAEYERLDREQPGLYGQVTARAGVLVRRLSLIYAILDRAEVVTPVHLQAALDLWRYCDESARFLFGDEILNPKARRIYGALLDQDGGMSFEEIRRVVFAKHLRAEDLQDAVRELVKFGMAEISRVPTGGRTASVVRATLPQGTHGNANDNLDEIVL